MIPTVLKERILLAVVGLVAVCSTAQTEGSTWEQTAWRSALYYRTTFEAPEAGEGLLHMAAADSFAAYFNGELVGSDSSAVQREFLQCRWCAATTTLLRWWSTAGAGRAMVWLRLWPWNSLRGIPRQCKRRPIAPPALVLECPVADRR